MKQCDLLEIVHFKAVLMFTGCSVTLTLHFVELYMDSVFESFT